MHEHRDITAPLAQCGDVEGHYVQAKIQILAEGAVLVRGFEVAVGGRNHPHIDLDPLVAAHRAYLLFLQNAQQLGLKL